MAGDYKPKYEDSYIPKDYLPVLNSGMYFQIEFHEPDVNSHWRQVFSTDNPEILKRTYKDRINELGESSGALRMLLKNSNGYSRVLRIDSYGEPPVYQYRGENDDIRNWPSGIILEYHKVFCGRCFKAGSHIMGYREEIEGLLNKTRWMLTPEDGWVCPKCLTPNEIDPEDNDSWSNKIGR